MSNETHAWTKGNKVFWAKPNTKHGLAFDLIICKNIHVPNKDKLAALKNPIKYLESKGWKWKRLAPYKSGYYWICYHDNGKGGFNPDYEKCGCKGKLLPTLDEAVNAALKHGSKHGYCGWGYQPHGWFPSMGIIHRDKKGRERGITFPYKKEAKQRM